MFTNLSDAHSLVSLWLSELRDTTLQTNSARFRHNLERIGEVCAWEISKTLDYTPVKVTTHLGTATGQALTTQPVIATILRAGLPLHQGLLHYFDQADSAFIGAYRKHSHDYSFVIDQQYVACPPVEGRPLIIADTMLATGASLTLAINTLLATGQPSALHIVCVIASAAGIQHIQDQFPTAHLWAGAVDPVLSAANYIVPGLGDAGDLCFGKKLQF